MTATLLAPPDEIIHLSGMSWKTYETLLEELSDRRLRLTYNRGNLEITAPSPEHELNKRVLGRFIDTIAEELEVNIYPLGSTTFKQPELSGSEPWIYNGESLVIQQLQNGTYIATQTSQFFANLSIPDIASWLQRSTTMDYLALVKAFRGWVRSQIGK